LIRAENSLLLAKTVLANRIGVDHSLNVKEPAPSTYNSLIVMNDIAGECTDDILSCLQQSARTNRAEIMSLNIDLAVAEKEIKYRKGSYWPDLTLEGVYFRETNEPSRTFELDESIYGAIKLNFPFFEGGLRRAEVAESRAQLRQTEYVLEQSSNAVNVEVEEAYLNMKSVSSIIFHLEAEVTYAADNYRSVEKQFQHGLADSIDVIDANTLLVTAERELANAQYDYQFSIIQLKRAVGVLLASIKTG
jgi:outer membrane protein